MKLIDRQAYLKQLVSVIGTPDIKVLTGVRRSGKSKLLEALKPSGEFPVISQSKDRAQNFVMIDEVQMCDCFEKAINGLHATEKFDIYITGSNAFLLSSDLATLFTGRTFEIKVYPFSFKEYLSYYPQKDKYEALSNYLKEGGMSGSYLYREPEAKYKYIADIFDTLIVRDIRTKYKIRNIQLMDRLVDYLIDNIANLTSARNIKNILENQNETVNHTTISSYIQYLCNAYAFYKIRRYDIKGKKYLSSNDKYYLCDHTFRYAKLGTRNMDYGRMLENIVAIELLRRGYEVYVGVLYKKEIDFIAIKRSEKIYIQVSDNINDDKTFDREVSPLLQIKDAYPKIIIARTRNEPYEFEGIKIIDLADWLTADSICQN